MPDKKVVQLTVGVAVTAFFFWLILRQVDFDAVLADLGQARLGWLAAAVMFFSVGYACRIERWRTMLHCENPSATWTDCAGPFVASVAMNNVLPFRAGDILRVFAFRHKIGVNGAQVLATVVVERLLDLLILLTLLSLALAYFRLDTLALLGLGGWVLMAIAICILLVLLFPRSLRPIVTVSGDVLVRMSPKLGAWFSDRANSTLDTAIWLSNGTVMLRLLAWSVAAWLCEGMVFYAVALSLPAISDPLGSWLALPVGTLSTLIPSTPGYVGTFDYFVIQAMTACGIVVSAATAYALLVHAVLWLPVTVVGGLWLVIFGPKGYRRDETPRKIEAIE